jgi:hypothetical protein
MMRCSCSGPLGPHKGPGVLVVAGDEVQQEFLQFFLRGVNTLRQALLAQDAEENFHQVDPGSMGRGVVETRAGMSLEPAPRCLVLVGNLRIGLPVAVAAGLPTILFVLWYASSAGFREFVLSLDALDARVLTIFQTWRIGGAVFVVLYSFGLLPAFFALPAGWDDVAIGATAPLVAWSFVRNDRRAGFLAWQALGILDLVTALNLGTTARLINPAGPSITPLTVLPQSMIPTFIVPLLLILHVICIAQAKRWDERGYSRVGGPLGSSALCRIGGKGGRGGKGLKGAEAQYPSAASGRG